MDCSPKFEDFVLLVKLKCNRDYINGIDLILAN
jgi:hypothetical protein